MSDAPSPQRIINDAAEQHRAAWQHYFVEAGDAARPDVLAAFRRHEGKVGVAWEADLLRLLLDAEVDVRRRHNQTPDRAEYERVVEELPDVTDCRKLVDELVAGKAPQVPSPTGLSPETVGVGSVLGTQRHRYELLEQLRSGGMGAVWKARRQSDNKYFAVKLPKPGSIDWSQLIADEIEKQINLPSHRNIVAVVDASAAADPPFIVLEYIDGGKTLRDLLRGGPLPPEKALRLLLQVAEGLAFLHGQHDAVYHRDLKPENILLWTPDHNTLLSDGVPKVTDFGLAVPENDQDRYPQAGTPFYRSPDTLSGRVDSWAGPDIWALGVVLYEALTGRRPFSKENQIRTRQRAKTLDEALPGLRYALGSQHADELQGIVDRCLFPNSAAAQRYGSALHVANDLNALLEAFRYSPPAAPSGARKQTVAVSGEMIQQVAPLVRRTLLVKTILNPEREETLVKFYYPTRVLDSAGRSRTIDTIDAFDHTGPILVQGFAGQGKSIFFRYLTGTSVGQGAFIPLYLEFRHLGRQKVRAAIAAHLAGLGVTLSPEDVDLAMSQGAFVLLLDSFDELPEESRGRVSLELQRLHERYPALRLLISSRPHTGLADQHWLRVFKIAPLERDDCVPVVRKYAGEVESAQIAHRLDSVKVNIYNVLTSPLMIALLVIHFRYSQSIPHSTVEFYKDLFDLIVRRHNVSESGFKRQPKSGLDSQQLRSFFEALCFVVRKEASDDDIHTADLEEFGKKAALLANISCQIRLALDDITRITNLIVEEGGYCRFIHKSVKEYNAAAFIAKETEEHASTFYTSVRAKWRSWDSELFFLSLIDSYRFVTLFAIPDIESVEHDVPENIVRNYGFLEVFFPERRRMTVRLAEPKAYCLRGASVALKNQAREPILKMLGSSVRSKLPTVLENTGIIRIPISELDVRRLAQSFQRSGKGGSEEPWGADGARAERSGAQARRASSDSGPLSAIRSSLTHELYELRQQVEKKRARTSDFHV